MFKQTAISLTEWKHDGQLYFVVVAQSFVLAAWQYFVAAHVAPVAAVAPVPPVAPNNIIRINNAKIITKLVRIDITRKKLCNCPSIDTTRKKIQLQK